MTKMITSEEAVPSKTQHTKPCGDCPFRRVSIAGWLGDGTPASWLQLAHSEAQINCHTLIGPQCAGGAIYRANVLKRPRNLGLLVLPQDKKVVFATPAEFLQHHNDRGRKQ